MHRLYKKKMALSSYPTYIFLWYIKNICRPDMVANSCNPSTLGGWGRRITWGKEFQTAWPLWGNPASTKNTKISQVWWRAPVIPATWEAEAGELLKLGGRGCISQDHTTALQPEQQRETPSQLKKKRRRRRSSSSNNSGGKGGWLCRAGRNIWKEKKYIIWARAQRQISLLCGNQKRTNWLPESTFHDCRNGFYLTHCFIHITITCPTNVNQ